MSGIAGIVADRPDVDLAPLHAMSDAIIHRGRDHSHHWSGPGVALAQRTGKAGRHGGFRADSHVSQCGRYTIVCDGEVYNRDELWDGLARKSVVLESDDDTGLFLAGFVALGPDFLDKCNGIWALAIWDREAKRLFVARDRFGDRPLYYAICGSSFMFASEIKAILATGLVERNPNPVAVADFCAERILDHTGQTFFAGVQQVPPAQCGWWVDGRLQLSPYWRVPVVGPEIAPTTLVDEVRALVQDAVRLRASAAEPVATLLSGGLDSSTVTCLVAGMAGSEHRINAFSTIDKQPPDEAKGIDLVLQMHANIDLHVDQPLATCLDDDLDTCAWHQEEPFADGSMLAHFRLMRLAHECGARTVLTGQAADEVFAGYPDYLKFHLASLIRGGRWHQATRFLRLLRESGQHLDPISLAGQLLPKAMAARARRWRVRHSVDWLASGFNEVSPELASGYSVSSDGTLNGVLRQSITRRTLPGLLHHEDRNCAAFGITARAPFLDHRVVEMVLPLPADIKLDQARTKSLLRTAFADTIPAGISTRLSKQGYPAPLYRWLREGPPAMRQRLLEQVAICPLIHFERWQARYNRFMEGRDEELPAVWRGMIVSVWHRQFIASR